ncbi:hypothetical protein [Sphaerisporangium corydalis]|uniref:Secreted protein n=1 Tax=Sphaerisporangium corydalis TaxID=1441875 RepID=A0ABV9EI06_9ACTN|nr:hypothetical protein [Sphaerisporangium corydalis]
MHRTIRTTLGLAAATAVLAIGLPAAASSASAATVTKTATASSFDFDDSWGYYYSKYWNGSRAKARGDVYEDEHHDGRFHVEGKLYDKNTPNWLCGYVQVKFEDEDGDDSTYWAKKCGSNGYRYFHFYENDVDSIQVRTCYYDNHHASKKSCGRWNYIYESDSEE